MQVEKIIAIYHEMAGKDSPTSLGSVASEVGISRRDVECMVLLIRSLPFFKFDQTPTGRMKRLEITAQAPGCYGHELNMNSSRHFFYKDGVEFEAPRSESAMGFAAKLEDEARAAGLVYIPVRNRIEALAPMLSALLVEQVEGEPSERVPVTRVRRGKVVVVPEQWVGKITTEKTIRQRPSKLIGKVKRQLRPGVAYKDAKDVPLADD